MTTKLTHPDSKHVVETDDPAMYLSQGWVEGNAAPKPRRRTTTPKPVDPPAPADETTPPGE